MDQVEGEIGAAYGIEPRSWRLAFSCRKNLNWISSKLISTEYYRSTEWKSFLQSSLENLLSMRPVRYEIITPSILPDKAGVYLISELVTENELCLYVGRSKNLQNRIYTNHLMGNLTNARLKKYMCSDQGHSCFGDAVLAKNYIRTNCLVRWVLEDDIRKRGALEGYFTAMLFPKYGIAEEH